MSEIPVFTPASPQAKAITDLFSLLLILCAVILAIVSGMIIYSLVRFRARAGDGEPRQIVGNKRLEFAWTLIPFLLLVYIFIATGRSMSRSDPLPRQREADLVVVGHQWWWEVRYPRTGVVTANEIHIPTAQALLLRLESADVIHDFWAPALGRKMDMVPGHPNHIWLQADRPGVYLGFCAEYCGAQHAGMRFRVVAQPPAEFQDWERDQLKPPPAPTTPETREGEKLFQQLTCANCHPLGSSPERPKAAPDLAHLASRRMLAGEVLDNTPENLKRWLRDPQAYKPGSLMPNLRLSDAQAAALTAYLEILK